ncbi:hypothetical protein [Methanosarcina sp. KYL-1]|nr:hypothetical protein [Methanosarcina sp. KYL-1]
MYKEENIFVTNIIMENILMNSWVKKGNIFSDKKDFKIYLQQLQRRKRN